MLKERNDHSERGKKDKVVARELCSVMSKGTRTYCHLDDLSILTDENQGQLSQTSLLICIKEKSIDHLNMDSKEASSFHSSDNLAATEYGVCIVDSILGTIKLAQFEDDKLRSRLRTLLSQYNPNEVILEKGNYSQETVGTVRLISPNASFEYLKSSIELPDNGESVVKMLYDGQYFGSVPDISLLPCLLKAAVLGLKDGSSELLMCALGGVLWQLKRSLIDYEVLSMRQISGYVPPDIQDYGLLGRTSSNNASVAMANISELKMDEVSVENIEHPTNTPKVTCMTLDAIALTNLEILKNNFDQTENGSLWAFVNRCKTQFGQRLLKDWLCHPLYQVNHIRNRSVAVNELLTDLRPQADETRTVLKSIPDLERLLARIHSNGLKKKGPNSHPDTRAILFEDQIYSSRKIKDFIDVLAGFETILKVDAIFQQVRPSSVLLQRVTQTKENSNVGRFPAEEVRRLIRYYREIFDEKQV
jgi:DNA mismatch repair protein MSH6